MPLCDCQHAKPRHLPTCLLQLRRVSFSGLKRISPEITNSPSWIFAGLDAFGKLRTCVNSRYAREQTPVRKVFFWKRTMHLDWTWTVPDGLRCTLQPNFLQGLESTRTRTQPQTKLMKKLFITNRRHDQSKESLVLFVSDKSLNESHVKTRLHYVNHRCR